jgi:hypothetical protein
MAPGTKHKEVLERKFFMTSEAKRLLGFCTVSTRTRTSMLVHSIDPIYYTGMPTISTRSLHYPTYAIHLPHDKNPTTGIVSKHS